MSEDSTNPPAVPAEGDINSLPQWARDAISRANNEAAGRRVEIRQLTDQNTQLQNQVVEATDNRTAAEKARDDKDHELLKLNVALSAGVPGEQAAEFAELLQGSNEQELRDYAEKVRKFGGPTSQSPVDPSQGRGGNDNTPLTPEAEFEALLKRQGLFS